MGFQGGVNSEDGGAARRWKPASHARVAARAALDLLLPPRSLDGGARTLAGGLSADAWTRIRFIDGPVCDGCGQPVILITDRMDCGRWREARKLKRVSALDN